MDILSQMMEIWRQEAEERKQAEKQRRQEDEERRREEDRRRQEEDRRRQEEDRRRREDDEQKRKAEEQRFLQLFATLTTSPTPPQTVGPQPAVATDLPTSAPSSGTPALKSSFPPPLAQDVTLRSYKEWRQRWDDYAVMIDLHNLPQHKQLIHLRACISADMRGTLEHCLGVSPASDLPLIDVLQRIQAFVRDQKNEALRRLTFSQCMQAHNEKFTDFYVRLKQAADDVDLCKGHSNACIETQIKHPILIGVQDRETKQRLSEMKSDATLEDVITVCRSREAAESTTQELRPLQPATRAVSVYKQKKRRAAMGNGEEPHRKATNRTPKSQQPQPKELCEQCGYRSHVKKKCPASTSTCRTCGKVGHFASRCKSTKKKMPTPQGNVLSVSQASHSIAKVCAVETESCVGPASPTIRLLVQSGDSSAYVDCIPDTGSDTSVMNVTLLKSLGLTTDNLEYTDFRLHNPDGSKMNCTVLGSLYASMTVMPDHHSVPPQEATCHQPPPSLPSQQIPLHPPRPPPLSASPDEAKKFFLREFSDGLMTKEDFRQGTKLKEMCGPPMRIFGIITPAGDEPSQWCHPLVAVAKPNGGVRITVDLTKLNSQVLRPSHPSPTPHDGVRRIKPKARYFSTLDALYGYWQIPLEERDQHLTTFITLYGRFRFCRGPMGFVATGDEYCRRGDIALDGVQQCVKVVEDVLLWDEDYASHLKRVREVLMRCRAHGITVNAVKFVLAAPEVSFCGYTLSGNGIAAEEEKVCARAEFPKTAKLTDLRSFMGLVNQLAEFTPAIAESADVLRPLMSPKRAFIWTPDHDASFSRVKKALSQPPVLAHFDPALKTILQTDASRLYGVGYALLQEHKPEEWRLVQRGDEICHN
ncbi:uncharacterized protein LOC125034045 [Penaeus chinensis]|uniref:uncharacterized protein LOC125034045 n=1 Tax=Penaeus chinensis TaxID=139456 RepID=UPI001FB624DF|nr:uncharacterized protein LOC125034045 [Penaeus chinensis]